jgi:hypothetical protein
MPARIHLPEAAKLRRLAASLATSLSATTYSHESDDMTLSVGHFFQAFPWTGKRVAVPRGLPTVESATVGQYFVQFPWDYVGTAIYRKSAVEGVHTTALLADFESVGRK